MEIIRKFLTSLREEGIRVDSAYLYGSYASGTETRWSDIDVAIISPDISHDSFEERIRLSKLSSRIDTRIEPMPFTGDTFVDENPIVWEIKRKGISI
jgi:predicted nucleotidyltransferase